MELNKTRWWVIWLFAMLLGFLQRIESLEIPAFVPYIFYVAGFYQWYRMRKKRK